MTSLRGSRELGVLGTISSLSVIHTSMTITGCFTKKVYAGKSPVGSIILVSRDPIMKGGIVA